MSRLGLAVCLLLAAPTVASAHIHLLQPKSRTDNPTGDQKERHCGNSLYSRAANPSRVTWFKPGEKIVVKWQETVRHPGWYRISFQANGEVFSYPPPGNAPNANGDPSNFPTVNQTGVTDSATGAKVLLDRIPDGEPGTTQMAEVTLPNIECSNCTLQFNQFMTDRTEYTNTDGGAVYFHCADIVLSNSPPPPPMVDAGPVDASPDGGYPADGRSLQGGCSTSGTGGSLCVLLAAVAALVRRRSRRTGL